MKVAEWFDKNRYKASSFSNIKKLVELKRKQKTAISVVIPTLNEESTIGKIIEVLKENLMQKYKLVDEIVVIDSGSTDKTRDNAKKAGANV
jgi:glucosyl-3-phosphoglycerate synthase